MKTKEILKNKIEKFYFYQRFFTYLNIQRHGWTERLALRAKNVTPGVGQQEETVVMQPENRRTKTQTDRQTDTLSHPGDSWQVEGEQVRVHRHKVPVELLQVTNTHLMMS